MGRFSRLVNVVFGFWIFGFGSAVAQYRLETWNVDNGLPNNSVNSILQTHDGFLWISTFGGLARYDGANFRVFNTVTSAGLRTSRFGNLFEDRDGALWVTTEGQGISRYVKGEFQTFTSADGLPDNSVGPIFYDTAGHLLLDTSKGIYEWSGGHFVPSHPGMPTGHDSDKLVVARTAAGVLWFSDRRGLLHKYEHDRETTTIPVPSDVLEVCEDARGRLWMDYGALNGSRSFGVYRDGRFTAFPRSDVTASVGIGCADDGHGGNWFGISSHGGLLHVEGDRFTRYSAVDGLGSDFVRRIYCDREGSIWVGTNGGLTQVLPRAVVAHSTADGLAGANVYPILQDRSGAVWVGSWPGLSKYENGRFSDHSREFRLEGSNVMSIFEDHDGALWVGCWGCGVRRMNRGKLEVFPASKAPGSVVRAISQDRAGEMWFGGTSGLARGRDGSFTHVGHEQGFSAKEVYSLFQDRQGNLWIGSDTGVTRYRDGTFKDFTEADGFPGRMVRSFYEEADGTLWLGTYDTGLFRFRNGVFTRFTTTEGLPDNGAFQILDDQNGNFWLTSNLGIYRVSRKELQEVADRRLGRVTAVAYGKPDGMLTAECNGGGQPSGIRVDQKLWIPTQNGIAVVDPGSVEANPLPPPVVIEEVLVDRRSVAPSGSVAIEPGQSDVEIRFAALTFQRPELAEFKYRLAGLDRDWIDARHRRVAYYSHLPFGTYQFQVIAANRDGIWNLTGAGMDLRVLPPLWRTTWFETLAALSAGALSLLAYNARMRHLSRKQSLHEDFARQLLDSQERDRKRIAGELHDGLSQTLSIIRHRAELSLQNENLPDRVRDQVEEIAAASSEALDEIREIVHELRPVEIDRLGVTKAIAAMIKRVAGSCDLKISMDLDVIDRVLPASAEINLYRMVQESLNNVLRHSDASEAAVELRLNPQTVEVTVRDNGKGFATKADADKGDGSGMGLAGVAERARLVGGLIQVQSAPGEGTKLTIRIGLENERHD